MLTEATEQEATGTKVSANEFRTDYCLPMKRREVWITSMKEAKFPELWLQFPGCARLERFLASAAGRVKIMNCIKAGVGLSGDPKNPEVRGIEECHAVIDELAKIQADRLKDKKNAGAENSTDPDAAPASGPTEPASDAAAAATGAGGAAAVESAESGLSFFEKPHEDPIAQKASELSLKEMLHITQFTDLAKMLDEIEETVSTEPV